MPCVCETDSNNCLCSLQDKSDTFQLTASATVTFDALAENTVDRMVEPDQASVRLHTLLWSFHRLFLQISHLLINFIRLEVSNI